MKLQEKLKAFVDGETQGKEYIAIRKLLKEHPENQKEIEGLNRLSASIQAYMTRPEPVGLEATLQALEKAPDKPKSASLFSHQLSWVGGFAAVVVLIGVASSVLFPVFAQTKASAKRTSALAAAKARAIAGEDFSTSPAPDAPLAAQASAAAPRSGSFEGNRPMDGVFPDKAKASAGGFAGSGVVSNGTVTYGGPEQEPQKPAGLAAPNSTHATSPANRSLIQKTASLSVKVKDVNESQQTVEGIAVGLGGYVQQSSRTEAEGQKGEANLTVRVPVQMYDSAIKRIRGLGDVLSDSSTGNDVTADVVDMDARMKVLKAEESDYMTLLGRARSIAAIMEIKDKLTEIREEIENIDGQRKSTKDLATYSTINVQLTQKGEPEKPKPEEDKGWLNNTWSTAVDGLSAAGKVIAQLFIFLLVWSPLWIPVALLSSWLYRRNKW